MAALDLAFSETLIWPTSQKDQDNIPLWLKFFCYEYSDSSLLRAATSLGVGPMLKCIMLPAPKEFVTKTDNIYDSAPQAADKDPTLLTEADPQTGVFGGAAEVAANWTEKYTNAPNWLAEEYLGVGAKIKMDMTDSKYRGTNKRIYNFKIVLAARSVEDSNMASKICDTFESLSLAQGRIALFSKFVSHPPLWKFGIGPGGNANIDRQWSGQPQLSFLDQITVSKTGFQDSYGISDENGEIKPLNQTINMTFVELEPALRSSFPGSSDIVNRSVSFWTLGGSAVSLGNSIGSISRGGN